MKRPSYKRVVGYFVAAIVIALIASLGNPYGHHVQKRGYETESENQMRNIRLGNEAYREDHDGKFPEHLADLLLENNYVADVHVFLFESPYTTSISPKSETLKPVDSVGIYSPYRFLPLSGNRFVVFEQPGMWKSGEVRYVVTGSGSGSFEDGKFGKVSGAEFEGLLNAGFPGVTGSEGNLQSK